MSEVDTMQNIALKEQRRDVSMLSERLKVVETTVAAIEARIDTLMQVCRAIAILAGAALGVDLFQYGGDV
tara:strand:+ start:9414 stop:9623 length:210 start_codon:yes stop_codon:yes gene_type:complete